MSVAANTEQQAMVMNQLHSFNPENVTPYETFDIPEIFTLVAKPPEAVRDAISHISILLRGSHPEHYYYAPGQYHATLLAIGSSVNRNITNITRKIIYHSPVNVSLQGLGISAHGLSVPVYADPSNSLGKLRNELRTALVQVSDTKNKGTLWDDLSWVNFLRFTSQPSQSFIIEIQKYVSSPFGTYTIDKWGLYKTTSRVLDPAQSTLIETFTT